MIISIPIKIFWKILSPGTIWFEDNAMIATRIRLPNDYYFNEKIALGTQYPTFILFQRTAFPERTDDRWIVFHERDKSTGKKLPHQSAGCMHDKLRNRVGECMRCRINYPDHHRYSRQPDIPPNQLHGNKVRRNNKGWPLMGSSPTTPAQNPQPELRKFSGR